MQQPHHKVGIKSTASPDYLRLVQFLIQPFLESPESLSVDCEVSPALQRVWIRIAFDSADKGKVFGRGGRNIQAIRTVIAAAALSAGESVYLDIYGTSAQGRDGMSFEEEDGERLPPPKSRERREDDLRPIDSRSIDSRPIIKPRSRNY